MSQFYSLSSSCLLLLALTQYALGHSMMSEPESTAPMTCRLGGADVSGNCAGPCDLRAMKGRYANHGSTSNPAKTYSRGQTVNVKYQRNNHGPGGFNRLTLVLPKDMMNKAVHTRNAFAYSCWGANPVTAKKSEMKLKRFGFSLVGNDGEEHSLPKAYYTTRITIPPCVPDGDYLLGWVWFGGTGTPVKSNRPQKPWDYGFFSDYWSCSFVRIKGGAPLRKTCSPTFNNDMKQFSKQGCMAGNDSPGICTYEPCRTTGKYQKPRPFKSGKPPVLHSWYYGGKKSNGIKNVKKNNGNKYSNIKGYKGSCGCISASNQCAVMSRSFGGYCKRFTVANVQPFNCKISCCKFCKSKPNDRSCQAGNVRRYARNLKC